MIMFAGIKRMLNSYKYTALKNIILYYFMFIYKSYFILTLLSKISEFLKRGCQTSARSNGDRGL